MSNSIFIIIIKTEIKSFVTIIKDIAHANEKAITFNYGVVEYEKRVTGDKVVFGEE